MLRGILFSTPLYADLQQYVKRPEPEFSWSLNRKIPVEQTGDLIYDLRFISQVWQGTKWEHQLQIYAPREAARNATTMFIWVTGGFGDAFLYRSRD